MGTIKKRFIYEMNSFIKEAEINLLDLGFDPKIWKDELAGYEFKIGVYHVTSRVSKESNKRFNLTSKVDIDQAKGIQAMRWARIAGFAHLAKTSTCPFESFALGYSVRQEKLDINQKKFADVVNYRRSEKGGKNRKGKPGAFSVFISELLKTNPKFRFDDLLREIRKEPDSKVLEKPLEKANIERISFDRERQEIEYELTINGTTKTKTIKHSSVRNKFSTNKK